MFIKGLSIQAGSEPYCLYLSGRLGVAFAAAC